MVRRIECHPVITFAASDRVSSNDLIRRRIYHSEDILILQVDVYPPRDRVVLRHPRFAIEVQSPNDFVFLDIDHCLRLASFI